MGKLGEQLSENGFTLVELMVVVAIIGILSAVAIPNFKKYQAKSKLSEAKVQIAAAYTAEQATMVCMQADINRQTFSLGANGVISAGFDGTNMSRMSRTQEKVFVYTSQGY